MQLGINRTANYIHYNTGYVIIIIIHIIIIHIKTNSSVSLAKKTKNLHHRSVLFTGTIKLLNLAFHIFKTTKLISTKFINFLPYIYTTSHTYQN